MASLEVALDGSLVWRTRYNAGLVAEFKAKVPPANRRWDAASKSWRVSEAWGPTLCDMTERWLGEHIKAPQAPGAVRAPAEQMRVFDVRYLGATKTRADGSASASGYCGGTWSVVFPESVLRAWFADDARPNEARTLFAVLGLASTATPQEIKGAYRRLARQWHPDICGEPDAHAIFTAINAAYEVLANDTKRAKYIAGLALVAHTGHRDTAGADASNTGYRAPLRCGMIMCSGRESLGLFVVSKVINWQDITNATGQTLIVSWPVGADKFTEAWQ